MDASSGFKLVFPRDFLPHPVDLGDPARLKVWGARLFVNQLRELYKLGPPTGQPNRSVAEALIDGILGELIAARDALRRELKGQISTSGLKAWRSEVLSGLQFAGSKGQWLSKIDMLRNSALHGNYLPKAISIGPEGTEFRLQMYPNGIIADRPLYQDLEAICDEMDKLITASRQALGRARDEKVKSPHPQSTISDWFSGLA